MLPTFDLERYLNNSQKVETRDLDFSRVRDYPAVFDDVNVEIVLGVVPTHLSLEGKIRMKLPVLV